MTLLKLHHLCKQFTANRSTLLALNQVSLTIDRGETLGLVGESGCGKSTLGKVIAGLHAPSSGSVFFDQTDLTKLSRKQMMPFRKRIQIIFQDPYASLNPRMTVEEIVGEPLQIHNLFTKSSRRHEILKLLTLVGLTEHHMSRYPHEFSGGQRQRIGIARALAVSPELLICDEPLSALDVSVQAQVVNLLKSLQTTLDLTYLFIAHDLSMVEYLSHRVAVMYRGSVVELAPTSLLFSDPKHPYTQALIAAATPAEFSQRDRKMHQVQVAIKKDLSVRGCLYKASCPFAMEICSNQPPSYRQVKSGHFVACHLYNV